MFAVWIAILRQVITPVVVFILLTRVLGVGLSGIWWGIFAITWSAALFTLFYARRRLRKLFNENQRSSP